MRMKREDCVPTDAQVKQISEELLTYLHRKSKIFGGIPKAGLIMSIVEDKEAGGKIYSIGGVKTFPASEEDLLFMAESLDKIKGELLKEIPFFRRTRIRTYYWVSRFLKRIF